MKFGPVPVEEAEGAILAHTHRLSSGALKKGRRLSAEDIARLRADALEAVIVARLEPGDVPEDEAAARLAAACAGDGVRVDAAKTGRANLFATRRGLLGFDPARLDRVNLVDAALTVATQPAFALVEPEQMVATVKVIPFAAPEGVVSAAEAAAQDILTVAGLRSPRAGLILTELPGVPAAQLDRARAAQVARVEYLGGALVYDARCAHDVGTVADRIGAARAAGADLVLVLGASAIVDPRDVIPEGLRAAGGVVEHVGMPVDPGNLTMLGRLGEARVLGVPGCARSLKRSGFDAVLERLCAGLEVTPQDIMRMGAGGLLSEISSRPAPRLSRSRGTPRVGAVVLAAGRSRRMGERNKLLEAVDGEPMLTRVVDALLASSADPVVVVTGHEAERVKSCLQDRPVRWAHNPDYAAGMSTSVKAGLAALGEDVDGALVALGDMPWVRAEHVDRLIGAFDPRGPRSIVVPEYGGKRGNPVLWSARHFAEMRRLTGDIGGRPLLEAHHDAVLRVAMPDGATQVDVDTPETLAALRASRER